MSLLTNLVSYWKFDGNSNDTVGSNNGTDTAIVYAGNLSGLLDSYSETNQDDFFTPYNGHQEGAGQTFTTPNNGNIYALDSCKFYMGKVLSPTGNAVAKVYAVTGTPGTNGKPTGSALAISDNLDVSTLPNYTTPTLKTFTFSGSSRIALSANTVYCIILVYTGGDSSNKLWVGADNSSPTHSGNGFSSDDLSAWTTYSGLDTCFYVYGASNGKINQGAGFNGATSKIDAGTFQGFTTGFSVAGWFKTSDNSVNQVGLEKWDNNGWLLIPFYSGKVLFEIKANSDVGFSSGASLSNNIWYHIAATYDGSNMKIYINGSLDNSTSQTGNMTTAATNLLFGTNGSTQWLNGAIDEVGIWSRALTSGEVTSLWNGGAGLAYPLTVNNSNMFLLF